MRFSIRDLLWLMVLAAVIAAWWVDHSRLSTAISLVPAEGIVTLRGQPLSDAQVMLLYFDDNIATGVTDRQGRFVLTYCGRSGALPGKRLVATVVKRGVQPTGNGVLSKVPLVPERYASPATSGLMVDIPSRGTTNLVIDLR